jgi:predicted nucleic acid-binding protein
LLAQGDDVWISTQVLQEFSNTLRKKFHREWSDVQAAITEICLNFEVYVNRPETVQDAISIAGRYGYTLYDSLILSSCLAIECKTLYSEDMQHKQIIDDSLIIVNPFQS